MAQDHALPFDGHDLKSDHQAVYGNNRYKRKRTSRTAKVLQVAIFLVVLSGVVVGSYFLYLHFFKNQTNTKKNKYSPPPYAATKASRFVFDEVKSTAQDTARDGSNAQSGGSDRVAAQSAAVAEGSDSVAGLVNAGYPYTDKPSEVPADVVTWAYHEWAGKSGKITDESVDAFVSEWIDMNKGTELCTLPGYVSLDLLRFMAPVYLIYLKWLESGKVADADKETLKVAYEYYNLTIIGEVSLNAAGFTEAYTWLDMAALNEDPDVKALHWPELSASFNGLKYPPIADSKSESDARLAYDWRDRRDSASRFDRHDDRRDHLVTHVKSQQHGSSSDTTNSHGGQDRTRDHSQWHRDSTHSSFPDGRSDETYARQAWDRQASGQDYQHRAADEGYSRRSWDRQGSGQDYQHRAADEGYSRRSWDRHGSGQDYQHRAADEGYSRRSWDRQGSGQDYQQSVHTGRDSYPAHGSHDAHTQQNSYSQQDGYSGRDQYHQDEGRDRGYLNRDVYRQRDSGSGWESRSQGDRFSSHGSHDTNRLSQQDGYDAAQQYHRGDGQSLRGGYEHGRRLAQRQVLADIESTNTTETNTAKSSEFEPVTLRVVFHIVYYYCGGEPSEGVETANTTYSSSSSDANVTTSGKYSCPGLAYRSADEAAATLVEAANEYLANEYVYGTQVSLKIAKVLHHNKQFHTLKDASEYSACLWGSPDDPISALGLNMDPSSYVNVYVCGSLLALPAAAEDFFDRSRDRADRGGRADTQGVGGLADTRGFGNRADGHAVHAMSAEAGTDQMKHIVIPFDYLDLYGYNKVHPNVGNVAAKFLATKIVHFFGVPPTYMVQATMDEKSACSTDAAAGDGFADTTPEDMGKLSGESVFQYLYQCTVGTSPTCGDDSWPALNGTCSATPDNIYNHLSYSPLYCHTHITPAQAQAFQKSLVGNFKSLYACSKASADGSCFA